MAKRYKPMHPQKRLRGIIMELAQIIKDAESYTDNNIYGAVLDVEDVKVSLRLALDCFKAWDGNPVDGSPYDLAYRKMVAQMESACREGG